MTAWTTAPHRTSRDRSGDIIRDYEWKKNPLEMIKKYIGQFMGEPAPRWAADTMAELERRPVDVVVTEISLPATLIPVEKLGIPTVVVVPNIWLVPTPGIPPIGPGFAPARGPLGWLRDATMRWLTRRAFSGATKPINATRHAFGLPPVAGVHEQMTRADEIHVLTSPAFDFTSPALPANLRYAGPQLDDPSWVDPWRSPWAENDHRPLVLVGLSSTFQDQVATLRRIAEVLSTLPVRAVLTLGGTILPSEVQGAENVVVVPTAPHGPLLEKASVLITHCGHGTTMKGLAAGVPIVCMPMGRDQNDNAARVVHRGAGVRLKPTAPAKRIRAAVEEVLRNPTYREPAQRLARALAAREGCIDPIASLERLAGRLGLE